MNPSVARTRLGMFIALWVGGVVASPVLNGQSKPVELDVPYVSTHPEVVDAMLKLANVTSADYVFDLGCGDGRIVIAAAKKYKARGFGVDLDPQRIKESNQNASKAGVTDLVKFKLADIMVTDVREASVVAMFLLQDVNMRLRPRLLSQLKPGSRVVSHGFHMGDWKADKVIRHKKAYGKVFHFWVVPAPVGGTWRWQTKTSGQEVANSLKLEQRFQVVSGAVDFPAARDVPIAEVSLTGKQLRFTATPRIGQKEVKVVYQGTVEGDAIGGTQQWLTGPSAGTYPWAAKRDRLDVTGRWRIIAPQRSNCNGTLFIRRKDGKFTAAYVRDKNPEKELPLPALYVWGSSIQFEIPSGWRPLVFSGSLAADTGEGTVSARARKKQTRWSAKRVAEK